MSGHSIPVTVPDPAVPPSAYDREYFLRCCAGAEEWTASNGAEPAAMYGACLDRAGFASGEVVVDIGTGRGELPAVAAARGAARAFGVEYSPDAVELARRTATVHGVADRVEIVLADARAVPIDDAVADLVTLLDVVEHLTPNELDGALREARRLLRPGGRLLVHTMPTRTLYAVTYRLQRLAWPRRWRTWPVDPRNDYERALHVNEQTRRSLRNALAAAGFADVRVTPGEWVYTEFLPDQRAARLYRALARWRPTAPYGVCNLWGEARRS
jgi:SAM-dependent methyltransferase